MASIRHLISVLLLNLTFHMDQQHIKGTTTFFSRENLGSTDLEWKNQKKGAEEQKTFLENCTKIILTCITVDWDNRKKPEGLLTKNLYVKIRLYLYFFITKLMASDKDSVVFDIEETLSGKLTVPYEERDWNTLDLEKTLASETKALYQDETHDCIRLEFNKDVVLSYENEKYEEKSLAFESSQQEITMAFSSPLEVKSTIRDAILRKKHVAKISTRTPLYLNLNFSLGCQNFFHRLGLIKKTPQFTTNLRLNSFDLPLKAKEEERVLELKEGRLFRLEKIDSENVDKRLAEAFSNINQTLLDKSQTLRDEYKRPQINREKNKSELLSENSKLHNGNQDLERKKNELEAKSFKDSRRQLGKLLPDQEEIYSSKVELKDLDLQKIEELVRKTSKLEVKIFSESREKVQKILSLQNYDLRRKIKELERGENVDIKEMLEELVQKELDEIRKKAEDLEAEVRKKNEQIEDLRRDLGDANFEVLMLKGEKAGFEIESVIPTRGKK